MSIYLPRLRISALWLILVLFAVILCCRLYGNGDGRQRDALRQRVAILRGQCRPEGIVDGAIRAVLRRIVLAAPGDRQLCRLFLAFFSVLCRGVRSCYRRRKLLCRILLARPGFHLVRRRLRCGQAGNRDLLHLIRVRRNDGAKEQNHDQQHSQNAPACVLSNAFSFHSSSSPFCASTAPPAVVKNAIRGSAVLSCNYKIIVNKSHSSRLTPPPVNTAPRAKISFFMFSSVFERCYDIFKLSPQVPITSKSAAAHRCELARTDTQPLSGFFYNIRYEN